MKRNLSDYIYRKSNFLSRDECTLIIQNLELSGDWFKHSYYSNAKGTAHDNGDEDLENCFLKDTQTQSLMQSLSGAIHEYLRDLNFSWFCGLKEFSHVRYNRYYPNQRMDTHCDHISSLFGDKSGVPIITLLGALNEDFEGGELLFFEDEVVEIKMGDLLIFPSNYLFPHKVNPVTKGVRYSYVSWGW